MKLKLVAAMLFLVSMQAMAFSYHDNRVNLVLYDANLRPVQGYISGSFTVKDFSISSGQDPKGHNWVGQVHALDVWGTPPDLEFSVGRHGTSKVADWFKNQVSSNQNTFGHEPGDLNFAFLGDLTLTFSLSQPDPVTGKNEQTVVFKDIVLAQGDAGGNNWWFGGKNCLKTDVRYTVVECAGAATTGQKITMQFHRGDAPHNGYNDYTILVYGYYADPNFKTVTIDSPKNGEKNSAPYAFSPHGYGTPSATINVAYGRISSGTQSSRLVKVQSSGVWSLPNLASLSPNDYWVTASQSFDGGTTFVGPSQTNDFVVTDPSASTTITSPPPFSWFPRRQAFKFNGTVKPASDAAKIGCYMNGSRLGDLTSYDVARGTWQCQAPSVMNAAKVTVSGRVTPARPGDTYEQHTYVIADLPTITSPSRDNEIVGNPATVTGTQEAGATVSYQSDCFGSGTAKSQGTAWSIGPIAHPGACTVTVRENFQGIDSPQPVSRRFKIAQPVNVRLPNSDNPALTNTNYVISGSAEPNTTVSVSIDNGWYPIANNVPVNAEGKWTTHGPGSAVGDYLLSVTERLGQQVLNTTEKEVSVESKTGRADAHE